jgi:hypothetical protein
MTLRRIDFYREIVTQGVCGFRVSNDVCKSSIIEVLVRRLIKPLMAFSDHLSSLELSLCCNKFLNVSGLVENGR